MTTDEMVSVVWDVIDAAMEAGDAAGIPDAEIGEFVEREGFEIRHVHDGRRVNVYAGSTWLFRCSPSQYREVLRRVEEDTEE